MRIAQHQEQAPVTVVIAARNAALTLAKTIAGLGSERHVIREVIVVDDGSTDDTSVAATTGAGNAGVALRLERRRFSGVGASRNAGMALAESEFIYFIDADDDPVAGGLALLAATLAANPDVDAVVGATIVRRPGRTDGIDRPGTLTADRKANARRLLEDQLPAILTGSFLLRRQIALANPFPEGLAYDEDVCFWAGLLARAGVKAVADPIVIYNASETRAAQRLTTDHRRRLLAAFVALNALARAGADPQAVRWRKARLARRVGSKLVKDGRHAEARRYLRMASAHPAFRDVLTARYRVQAHIGAFVARLRRKPITFIMA